MGLMELYRLLSMGLYGFLWGSMGLYGLLWGFMDSSMRFYGGLYGAT